MLGSRLQGRLSVLGMLVSGAALCLPGSVLAQRPAEQVPIPLPPMGWSSWNSFLSTVDSQIIQQQAQALISSRLRRAGYEYINIDEGWWHRQRDAAGNIVVDAQAWPALAPQERAHNVPRRLPLGSSDRGRDTYERLQRHADRDPDSERRGVDADCVSPGIEWRG